MEEYAVVNNPGLMEDQYESLDSIAYITFFCCYFADRWFSIHPAVRE